MRLSVLIDALVNFRKDLGDGADVQIAFPSPSMGWIIDLKSSDYIAVEKVETFTLHGLLPSTPVLSDPADSTSDKVSYSLYIVGGL